MAFKFKEQKKRVKKPKKTAKRISVIDQLVSNQEHLSKDMEVLHENVNNLNEKLIEIHKVANLVRAHSKVIAQEKEHHENISKEIDMRSQEVAEMHSKFSESIADIKDIRRRVDQLNATARDLNNNINLLFPLQSDVSKLKKDIADLRREISLIHSKETIIID